MIRYGFITHTHNGVFALLGEHFVSKGLISKEQNKSYKRLFELRQNGDYSDWFEIEQRDVLPFIDFAETYIADIKKLISLSINETNH